MGSNPTLRTTNRTHRTYEELIVRIQQHALWLKKQGYADSTIRSAVSSLKALAKDTDLFDIEAIKENIANRDITDGTKEKYVQIFDRFVKQHNLEWDKPEYHRKNKLPHVPLEQDIDQLIGALSKRQGTFLQFLKETGARAGEAWALKWIDIKQNNVVFINEPEKGSNARAVKVSDRLIAMLNELPNRCKYVFRYKDDSKYKSFARYFYKRRKILAKKLKNPKLLNVNMKSLRHFKATMEYHKTKDILHVKQLLGHKNVNNTLVYTHLVNFETNDDFIVKIAKNLEEFTELLENGFEYISDYNDMKVCRKRK